MDAVPVDLLLTHHALVPTDNQFQRRVRLLQSLWRDAHSLPIGEHRGRPLGSRLAMPFAEDTLSNYLTDTIRSVVRREVLDPVASRGKLYGRPRIFNDLLSSQPLCFNLFAELQQDLSLATRTLRRLTAGRIGRVTGIDFEHSPGRSNPRYTGDRSAFDVFVEYLTPAGASAFAAIEVKYHEALGDPPAPHRDRYDEVAAAMRCFDPSATGSLRKKPLQQIWRDHLLSGSLLLSSDHTYVDGFFAFLHPKDNLCCARAADAYVACLSSSSSFTAWTLEAMVDALRAEADEAHSPWIEALFTRYVTFDRIDSLLARRSYAWPPE